MMYVTTVLFTTRSDVRNYVASVLIYLFLKYYGYIFQKVRHKTPDVWYSKRGTFLVRQLWYRFEKYCVYEINRLLTGAKIIAYTKYIDYSLVRK